MKNNGDVQPGQWHRERAGPGCLLPGRGTRWRQGGSGGLRTARRRRPPTRGQDLDRRGAVGSVVPAAAAQDQPEFRVSQAGRAGLGRRGHAGLDCHTSGDQCHLGWDLVSLREEEEHFGSKVKATCRRLSGSQRRRRAGGLGPGEQQGRRENLRNPEDVRKPALALPGACRQHMGQFRGPPPPRPRV